MKDLIKLSETELEIMNTIWKINDPVTVNQLLELFKENEWKNSTVATFLLRLMNKGFLKKSKQGKTNYYTPIVTLEQYKVSETKNFINTIHNGSIKSFMTALADEESMTLKEIRDLKEWFEKEVGNL